MEEGTEVSRLNDSVSPSNGDSVSSVAVVASTGIQGGAEKYIVRLYRELSRMGVRGTLVGDIPGWSTTGLADAGVHFGPKWNASTIVRGLSKLPGERQAVRNVFETVCPDVSHLHFKREQLGMTQMLAKDMPVVWTEHGQFSQSRFGRAIRHWYRQAARDVDGIICVSDIVADDVASILGSSAKIIVVENSIDNGHYREPTAEERYLARRSLGMREDALVLAHVGRLASSKGTLVAAAASSILEADLIVAGEGPLAARLVAEYPAVTSLGDVPDARAVYWASDALLFLSDGSGEGFPTVLLEAAACGLPVIGLEDTTVAPLVVRAGGVLTKRDPRSVAMSVRRAVEGDEHLIGREWAMSHGLAQWARSHRDVLKRAGA